MNNREFHVLTEVYRLLSAFDSEEIKAASRLPTISEHMRSALEALAKESSGTDDVKQATAEPSASKRKRTTSKSDLDLSPDLELNTYRRNLLEFLLDTRHFPDKASLADFARKMGLADATDSKFSRQRVAQHICRYAMNTPTFRDELHALASKLGTKGANQTNGWMDLILGALK